MLRQRFFYLLISFIFFLIMMTCGHFFLKPDSVSKVNVLNDGWNVIYNETEYNNVSLPELRTILGTSTNQGDTLILKKDMVDLSNYSSPTLMFETRFSAFRVICNSQILEERFFNSLNKHAFIGCMNNFVPLPSYDTPVCLSIELFIAENGAYNYYESPVIGGYSDLLLYAIYNHSFIFTISSFLIIFGVAFFAIAIGFRSDFPEINMQIYSALLYITLGIWFLTQFKLLDLFIENYGLQTEIEYIALYLVVPLMYMVMGCSQNYLKNKVFLAFSIVGSLFAISLIFIHFLGLAHINQLLIYYQIDAIIFIIFMIVMVVKDTITRKLKQWQTIQLMGAGILGLSFIFNVIFYYMELAGISEQIMLSKKAVPVGAMCMVFGTMVNYQIYMSESYAQKKENESLAHLAYADGLTGIPNRSKLEKYLSDLSAKDENYCIVSIDLNGLKSVNDLQGHLMGDKYLSEFSHVLEECFKDKGFIARIGGDEFVVVLKDEIMFTVDSLLLEMEQELHLINQKDPSIKRSAAAGYAYRHEVNSNDWHSVYLIADERMYKNKAKKVL